MGKSSTDMSIVFDNDGRIFDNLGIKFDNYGNDLQAFSTTVGNFRQTRDSA